MKKVTAKSIAAQVLTFKNIVATQPANTMAATTLANLEIKLELAITDEAIARGKAFEAKHAGSDWWEEIKLLYPIVETEASFVVTSLARDWNPESEKEWAFADKWQALAKVEQLVKWLDENRRRGHGCTDKDMTRCDKIRAKAAA